MCSGPMNWLLICVINLAPGTGKFSGKESACQCKKHRGTGLIPRLGGSLGGGNDNLLQYSLPWTEEPGGLQSMGSQRVGHDWATELTHTCTFHGLGPIHSVYCLPTQIWDEGLGSCSLFCCLNMFLQVRAIPFFTQMCTLYQWFLNLTTYGLTWIAG